MRRLSLLIAADPNERARFLPEAIQAQVTALASEQSNVNTAAVSPSQWAGQLAAANPEVVIASWSTPPFPARLPPALRYVCYLAGSVKRLVTRAHLADGLLLTNWGSSISRVVAECALFHVLACLRQATRWSLALHRDGGWREGWEGAASLCERRFGIHGYGPVARALVELVRPFHCAVSVLAPDVDEGVARRDGIGCVTSLEALFSVNDVVVELAPLIPATRGIVTERHLRLLRPGGVFVNVGRAAVVDEAALIRVAREGRIFVGLDVFIEEPLPVASGLRGLANVSLTPHIGGPTLDRYADAGAFALQNLQAYAAGRSLQAVVTPEVYDRST